MRTHHRSAHTTLTASAACRTFSSTTSHGNDQTNDQSSTADRSANINKPQPGKFDTTRYGNPQQSPLAEKGGRQLRMSQNTGIEFNRKAAPRDQSRSTPTSADFDAVYDETRDALYEFRQNADADIDPKTGKPPTSIRGYIDRLQAENRASKSPIPNDDYADLDAWDMAMSGTSPSKKPQAKTKHGERLLSRLRQEEALQERLQALEEYGEPDLIKREPMRKIASDGSAYGFGRRKTSSASVQIFPQLERDGDILVNGKRYSDYFVRMFHRSEVCKPLALTSQLGQWDVKIRCWGGGVTGQAQAAKLALTRALTNYEPHYRAPLKKEFLFFRDSRMVERKKVGKYKARKGYTFVKR